MSMYTMEELKERYCADISGVKQYLKDKDCNFLMSQIIRELDSYTSSGRHVEMFIEQYGKTKEEYARKKRGEYNKEHPDKKSSIDLGIRKSMWEKEWEKEAINHEYFAKKSIEDFIEQVEQILMTIEEKGSETFVLSNALSNLVGQSSGINRIDSENKRLLDLYQKLIQKDFEEYRKMQVQLMEDGIKKLRTTSLYVHKNNNGLRTGDKRFIGRNGESITFEKLFEALTRIAKKVNINNKTESYTKSNHTNELENYSKRIAEFGKLIASLKAEQEKNAKERNNGYLMDDEINRLDKISNDIYGKIAELEHYYEKLKKNEEKYKKILLYVDAINNRINALDETIDALKSNDKGNINIFKNTILTLEEERNMCYESLKKNQEIIKMFDSVFSSIQEIKQSINKSLEACGEILTIGRERQEKEKHEKRKRDYELQDRLNAREEFNEANRQEIINKIKEEIIRQMSIEGFGPRVVNFIDTDHVDEDYTEFNQIFKQRLAAALRERNISFSESDLSNPHEKVEYHLNSKNEKEETNGIKSFPQDQNGKYIITRSDYERLFDKLEKEILEEKGSCSYNDVFGAIERYLGSDYISKLADYDEFSRIVSNHCELYKERDKSETKGRLR